MPPVLDTRLWRTPQEDLQYLSKFVVERALVNANNEWSEIDCEFGDERAYLSVSLATGPGDAAPTLRIEYGVQDTETRQAVGALAALWSREQATIKALRAIILDGVACDISSFIDRLQGYLELPVDVSEISQL